MSPFLANGAEQMELEMGSGWKLVSGFNCLAVLKSQVMGNDVQEEINVLDQLPYPQRYVSPCTVLK